ncbi:uncharacterized protein LOC113499999 isoform X2 [Trichoplusia ni]|uniref:Uncharacterized protein LOC113499999 isoform X2 n=1 Tax=Trichoplusia ni TaxID=7111 RepID=A0A7E5W711_TRINI|nr:uncharacterized protein LOC113499999 isoform X2 [Trichoplusia ni]
MARFLQGVRSKRILSELQQDDLVTNLRHCTPEENEQIFGRQHEMPEDNINTPLSGKCCSPKQSDDANPKEAINTNVDVLSSPDVSNFEPTEILDNNDYESTSLNSCRRRRLVVRSWSLSDLTQDTHNMISSLKKSPSVPALLAISNNLDVLIAFTRSDQIETVSDDVYQIPEERSSAEECVTEYQKIMEIWKKVENVVTMLILNLGKGIRLV